MTSEIGSAIAGSGGARRALAPLEFTLPRWERNVARQPRSRVGLPLGLAMYAAALWLAVENDTFRRFEAFMITPMASFFTGRHDAVTSNTLVFFALGTPRAFGLEITNECTSALLLIPLMLMMGSFAIFTRLSLRRQMVALICGTVLILAVNALRVAGIAWATWKFGFDPGYTYSHLFVGSAFSLVGFVGAMLAALWVLVRTERMKQAAGAVRHAWWVVTAPPAHRAQSGARGMARGRPPAAHRHRRRRE